MTQSKLNVLEDKSRQIETRVLCMPQEVMRIFKIPLFV